MLRICDTLEYSLRRADFMGRRRLWKLRILFSKGAAHEAFWQKSKYEASQPQGKKRKATTYKENTPGGKADGRETTAKSKKAVKTVVLNRVFYLAGRVFSGEFQDGGGRW